VAESNKHGQEVFDLNLTALTSGGQDVAPHRTPAEVREVPIVPLPAFDDPALLAPTR
jgi:hypothetical protein